MASELRFHANVFLLEILKASCDFVKGGILARLHGPHVFEDQVVNIMMDIHLYCLLHQVHLGLLLGKNLQVRVSEKLLEAFGVESIYGVYEMAEALSFTFSECPVERRDVLVESL